jgi:2-keto-4-pentenoate hydratase/2-oxohepta-3-ene-1,7-dioic acid hydratase in catechol pathway
MWGFLKSTDSIVGSGATVVLPPVDANIFHHEAELVVVFGKAGDHIPESQALEYVFGYTCGVDVSARMPPPPGGGGGIDRRGMPVSGHKSYNGFSPMGPCITSADEIGDPERLDVKLWVSGELRPNYNTSDLAHSIAESIAWATAITPVRPGDVLFMGTNHQGLGALQDGDHVEMEITNIGRLSFEVTDPLKRRWPRGVDEATASDIRTGSGAPGSRARPL